MEWTGEPVDIMMGSLTYGYRIKVPTKESGTSYDVDPERIAESGEYLGIIDYRVGDDSYWSR